MDQGSSTGSPSAVKVTPESRMPTHEVWGGYTNSYGECDEPRHLEDCFSQLQAEAAAIEWAMGKDRYAYVRVKDPEDCGAERCRDLGCFGYCEYPAARGEPMTMDHGPAGYDLSLEAVRKEMDDPVGQSIRGVFASLDELIALAADPITRDQVCAEKIALGQMLTRCQTLASFALANDKPGLRVIRNA